MCFCSPAQKMTYHSSCIQFFHSRQGSIREKDIKWHTCLKLDFHSTDFFLQVANLACSISNNEEGVKLVRMAATQIDSLCPQVSKIPVKSLRTLLSFKSIS